MLLTLDENRHPPVQYPSMAASPETYDVVVVGSGNAGFSAASTAYHHLSRTKLKPRVLLLEKSPSHWIGGNTSFTAGAYRTSFPSLDTIFPLVKNCPSSLADRIDPYAYTNQDFLADLHRVTDGRCDPTLARVLVEGSEEATCWLAKEVGVPFVLSFNRQAYEIDGRWRFWGGMVLAVEGMGQGLVEAHRKHAASLGVEVRFESAVVGLILVDEGDGAVKGVRVQPTQDGEPYEVHSHGGVILAAGGFEASRTLRQEHLGENWGAAYVRGTPYNTGDLLQQAVGIGAARAGDWAGCHSTCWDANAPRDAGSQELTNQYTKSGYPLGLMLNAEGRRFVDEGLDMRNYTYAKFGRAILGQPDGVAFQLWDADGAAWLRGEEYAEGVVERVQADSLEELAAKLGEKGLKDKDQFVRTLEEYNAAVDAFRKEHPDKKFDPSVKDGLSTRSASNGLDLDKTNWALPVTKPPFLAVKVTCGITFTFGGLKIEPGTARVVREGAGGKPIPGLHCAGEMVGGLFYGNYPGGSGLTAGAVFGRIAGKAAAERAMKATEATEGGRVAGR